MEIPTPVAVVIGLSYIKLTFFTCHFDKGSICLPLMLSCPFFKSYLADSGRGRKRVRERDQYMTLAQCLVVYALLHEYAYNA